MAGALRLGLNLGYWPGGPPPGAAESVLEAERLGFDSVWTAEAYGSDALMPLAWWGAATERVKLGTSIVQISARTPAATAMAAMTLDHLSGGGLVLRLGVSGRPGGGGALGKPLKSSVRPLRAEIPIFLAAEGPKNIALAGELCDGWLALFYSPHHDEFYREALSQGFARAGARRPSDE